MNSEQQCLMDLRNDASKFYKDANAIKFFDKRLETILNFKSLGPDRLIGPDRFVSCFNL